MPNVEVAGNANAMEVQPGQRTLLGHQRQLTQRRLNLRVPSALHETGSYTNAALIVTLRPFRRQPRHDQHCEDVSSSSAIDVRCSRREHLLPAFPVPQSGNLNGLLQLGREFLGKRHDQMTSERSGHSRESIDPIAGSHTFLEPRIADCLVPIR